jgi:putative ABC transport system substrate-binding protein
VNRRAFVIGLGAVLAAPRVAEAHQGGKVYRVGVALNSDQHRRDVEQYVLPELVRRGYVQGRNLVVEWRSAGDEPTRFSDVAAELVKLQPDIILVLSARMALAVKARTSKLPVVGYIADPVGFGLVPSLAHPGGNITGVVSDAGSEIAPKRLSLLKEAAPRISRVAVLSNAITDSQHGTALRDAARGLGLSLFFAMSEGPYNERAYRETFASFDQNGINAVLVIEQPEHLVHGPLIAELAAKYKLPSICPQDRGALIAYGVDFVLGFRRMAEYVDAILRGAKPAEMPLEQIAKYQLVINLKVAKLLGLTIPPSLLLRADQVIE